MPQVVESLAGEPSLFQRLLEDPAHVTGIERRGRGGCEDEVGDDSISRLSLALFGECREGDARELESASTALGLRLAELSRLGLQRVADGERPSPEVDVLPSEAEEFALPHPGRHGEGEEHAQSIVTHDAVNVQRMLDRLTAEDRLSPTTVRYVYTVLRIALGGPPTVEAQGAVGLRQSAVQAREIHMQPTVLCLPAAGMRSRA